MTWFEHVGKNAALQILGDLAQLGERVNGIHEVRGSIPLISTTNGNGRFGGRFRFRGPTRDRGAFTRVRFWCRADSAIAGPLRSGPVVTWIKQSIDSNNGGQSVPRTDLMTVFFGGVKYRL